MRYIPILIVLVLFGCTTAQVQSTLGQISDALEEDALSTEDVASGLKEALIQGISKGSDKASKVDGYFKNPKIMIPFPPEVKKVETKLRQIGLGNEVDRFVMTLNRGAEEAAKEAKPIFINAIRSMTIQDAWNILRGEKNAATEYLKRTTGPQLKARFQPVIKNALDQVNATKYYGDIVSTYNRIPLVEKVNPNLDEYATDRAIDGLFVLIEEEEANIRENPVARTTDLLRRVFSEQD